MHFQFDMTALSYPSLESTPAASADTPDLLRQMLEVQKEQLAYLRALLGAHDSVARWRAFVDRWREDFPHLAKACRKVLPTLERTYGKLIIELTENLAQDGSDSLENDFALQEFLDRYGMRLTQLGTILNLVAPFAEAGSPSESA
jgi:phytoene dehydrogenase-like protein